MSDIGDQTIRVTPRMLQKVVLGVAAAIGMITGVTTKGCEFHEKWINLRRDVEDSKEDIKGMRTWMETVKHDYDYIHGKGSVPELPAPASEKRETK